MCRQIYNWNIVNCDVKQQIHLTSPIDHWEDNDLFCFTLLIALFWLVMKHALQKFMANKAMELYDPPRPCLQDETMISLPDWRSTFDYTAFDGNGKAKLYIAWQHKTATGISITQRLLIDLEKLQPSKVNAPKITITQRLLTDCEIVQTAQVLWLYFLKIGQQSLRNQWSSCCFL